MPRLLCLIVVACALSRPARAERTVLVVPGDASSDVEAAAGAARAAGFTPVELGEAKAALTAAAAQEATAQRIAGAAVALGLEAARAHYLDQDFDAMIEELAAVREKTLVFTATPEQRQTLWELCFQRGLAFQARANAGDTEAAEKELSLAVAIDPERRPPKDVYGPDLNQAFTRAVAAVRGSVGKPFHVAVTPIDARVLIDGVALLAGAGDRTLRPGLHVVRVEAAGRRDIARVIDTASSDSIEIELAPIDAPSPAAVLGAAWARGSSRPGAATINALWSELARERKASLVLWVGSGSPVEVVVLDVAGNTSRESAATAAVATRAALARVGADATLGSAGSQSGVASTVTKEPAISNSRKWLIVGAVAAAAVAVVVTGLALSASNGDGAGRIEVGVVP